LDNDDTTDEDLVNAMIEYPKLMERPIVVHNNTAVIGRPPENVHKIL
jgi:arsenate reductase